MKLPFRSIINLLRPVQLLLTLLAYWLGVGLARYLGAIILPEPQIFGALLVVLVLAASNLLTEFFRPFNEPLVMGETRMERELLHSQLMVLSVSLLAVAAILAFLLQRAGFLKTDSAIILTMLSLLALANAIPPVRLVSRGLGELSSAVQIGSLVPTLAFLIQYGMLVVELPCAGSSRVTRRRSSMPCSILPISGTVALIHILTDKTHLVIRTKVRQF